MKRLSLIIPLFNAEPFLSRCLDSIINQDLSYQEFEVIIVNDGSTDNSLEVAYQYKTANSNIDIFSIEKTGVGAARNFGINKAIGKYLLFVDADDYVFPNSLADILKIMETQDLDVLRFNYENITEKGIVIPKRKNSTKSVVFSNNIVDGNTFLSEHLGWSCYAWSYLLKASFIKDNNLYFNPSIFFEDIEWLLTVLSKAKKVRSINKLVYAYVQHLGSITQSIQPTKKNKVLTDKLYVIDMLKQYAQITNNKSVKKWCEGMISITIMGVLAYVEKELPNRKNEIIKVLYNSKYLPLKSYHFTIKQLRDLMIINISPRLYCYTKYMTKIYNTL